MVRLQPVVQGRTLASPRDSRNNRDGASGAGSRCPTAAMAGCLVLLLLLASFYVSTVGRGSSAAEIMILSSSSQKNVLPKSTPTSAITTDDHDEGRRRRRGRRRHRILCYGDSLTAGFQSVRVETFPYAPYLRAALAQNGNNYDDGMVDVEWIGLPGWTAGRMVLHKDDDEVGLQNRIRAYNKEHWQRQQEQQQQKQTATTTTTTSDDYYYHYPVSLVILLAGTNDLGHGDDAPTITNHVRALHEICLRNNVPATVAVAIPGSAYQERVAAAATVAATVNDNLQSYCQTRASTTTSTFVKFPFAYKRGGGGGENWFDDGLHLSEIGYQRLGESLAPTVADILKKLET